jgi:hypothetical protein
MLHFSFIEPAINFLGKKIKYFFQLQNLRSYLLDLNKALT